MHAARLTNSIERLEPQGPPKSPSLSMAPYAAASLSNETWKYSSPDSPIDT